MEQSVCDLRCVADAIISLTCSALVPDVGGRPSSHSAIFDPRCDIGMQRSLTGTWAGQVPGPSSVTSLCVHPRGTAFSWSEVIAGLGEPVAGEPDNYLGAASEAGRIGEAATRAALGSHRWRQGTRSFAG